MIKNQNESFENEIFLLKNKLKNISNTISLNNSNIYNNNLNNSNSLTFYTNLSNKNFYYKNYSNNNIYNNFEINKKLNKQKIINQNKINIKFNLIDCKINEIRNNMKNNHKLINKINYLKYNNNINKNMNIKELNINLNKSFQYQKTNYFIKKCKEELNEINFKKLFILLQNKNYFDNIKDFKQTVYDLLNNEMLFKIFENIYLI